MQKLNKSDIMSVVNITLRLFIVCTLVAVLVASVNFVTKDRIEAYELEKTTMALDGVFVKGDVKPEYVKAETGLSGSVTDIYEVYIDGKKTGYGVLCEPTGFKDVIKMLVAFDSENAIVVVRVISLSETTGIGDKVMSDASFAKQFEGKMNSITLGFDGVDAISGATVSSRAVTKGVNDAISLIKIYSTTVTNNTDGEASTNE